MKTAIIGSRTLTITNLEEYIPENTVELVSGGAKGIDSCVKEFSKAHNIRFTEFLPDYNKYRKYAPLKRNLKIINYADYVIAFWEGKSKLKPMSCEISRGSSALCFYVYALIIL